MTDKNNKESIIDISEDEKISVERPRRENRNPRRGERVERNRKESNSFFEKSISVLPAGTNLSWGSIIAGAITAAACFATLSLLTAALGFGIFSPTNANPLAGVGVGTGIWTAITLVVSFLAGGFIAGFSARSTGMLHGAITWALSLLILVVFVINSIAQVLGMASNVAGGVAKGAADVAGSAVTASTDALSLGLDKATEAMGDVDTSKLQENVEKYLADTEIPELQPDYLNKQLEESKDEIGKAAKEIALNPDNAGKIVSDLSASLKDKAQKIADSADKDAIANAVSNNTQLNQTEAEEVTNNIYNGLDEANKQAQKALDEASSSINKLAVEADKKVEEAKKEAEKASNKISAGSVITFLGLIAALALSAWGGKMGEDKALELVRRK